MKIAIKRLREDIQLPQYQTDGAAAMDVHAALDKPLVIQPQERLLIPTGFALAVPRGYEVQLRARSGLSLKYGICLANGVGTIDSDYRGEVGVSVVNMSQEAFTIEPGMRIAQMVVSKYEQVQWQEESSLPATTRGAGGFGSTSH